MIRQLTLLVILLLQVLIFVAARKPQVPCYFIFGDSLVDSGNNNGLNTSAKANYLPYGIDFPLGATGRFTNGRTAADIIGQLLGFTKFIPPYAAATNQEISKGVNYGSGGAGIREETGRHVGDRISMDRQLLNHKTVLSRLSTLQSNSTFTKKYLKKCIYLTNMGSNDYINNYLIPSIYPTSNIYNSEQYAEVLVQQYSQQLKTLYNLGARKIVVFGLGQIGCTPAEIASFGKNGKPCVEWINDAVNIFNDKLKFLVKEFNKKYSHSRFTFVNLTSISAPQGGVAVPNNAPCCQVGQDGLCVPNSIPCPNRGLSVFYDAFHPTETANLVIATRSYIAVSPNDASPYDISLLARLK
ncbi:GDSL esterase/lipase At5g45670-like [Rutidosis leptorrhynchoides]|uniref:GDSL esterase/lipase At5g45670-like n=1 Tax=Rutidosis leptorrhynchoides TaxID=125765 RepID=UPI003A99BE87